MAMFTIIAVMVIMAAIVIMSAMATTCALMVTAAPSISYPICHNDYCQAQPQLNSTQFKSIEVEIALISIKDKQQQD